MIIFSFVEIGNDKAFTSKAVAFKFGKLRSVQARQESCKSKTRRERGPRRPYNEFSYKRFRSVAAHTLKVTRRGRDADVP